MNGNIRFTSDPTEYLPYGVRRDLLMHYVDESRVYHNHNHLKTLWQRCQQLDPNLHMWQDEVAWAISFHDVIYDTSRNDNEDRSARLFMQNKVSSLYRPEQIYKCIMMTKYPGVMTDPVYDFCPETGSVSSSLWDSLLYVLDADLLGLSRDDEFQRDYDLILAEYRNGHGHEFGSVQEYETWFLEGRVKFFDNLLKNGGDRIYRTNKCHETYGQDALKNVRSFIIDSGVILEPHSF